MNLFIADEDDSVSLTLFCPCTGIHPDFIKIKSNTYFYCAAVNMSNVYLSIPYIITENIMVVNL